MGSWQRRQSCSTLDDTAASAAATVASFCQPSHGRSKGPMYPHPPHRCRLRISGPKNIHILSCATLHGTQTTWPFQHQDHHLRTPCLIESCGNTRRGRIRRSKNPTSQASTSSSTSLAASVAHVRHFGDKMFVSTWEEKQSWGCFVVILHELSHPVFWTCFATEFCGFVVCQPYGPSWFQSTIFRKSRHF